MKGVSCGDKATEKHKLLSFVAAMAQKLYNFLGVKSVKSFQMQLFSSTPLPEEEEEEGKRTAKGEQCNVGSTFVT